MSTLGSLSRYWNRSRDRYLGRRGYENEALAACRWSGCALVVVGTKSDQLCGSCKRTSLCQHCRHYCNRHFSLMISILLTMTTMTTIMINELFDRTGWPFNYFRSATNLYYRSTAILVLGFIPCPVSEMLDVFCTKFEIQGTKRQVSVPSPPYIWPQIGCFRQCQGCEA